MRWQINFREEDFAIWSHLSYAFLMTIWITGCSSGLGRELVKEFSQAGHQVVGGARRPMDDLSQAYPGAKFIPLDVALEASVIAFCEQAYEFSGAPDLLINNAAIINDNAPLWEITAADFDALVQINISGVANMIRHAIPRMIAAEKGVVVNLSSGWGRSTSPNVAPYCASKWAIEGLTQALAQELPTGLAAVALNPGIIDTDMLKKTFGSDSSHFPNAEAWAKTAAPFILNLGVKDNGASLTAP